MTDKPTTRKDLMKPVQLLGLAFIAALFAGFVTLMSMGFFQTRPADQIQRALIVALVAAGATFIIVLVSVALMLLAVDPSKVTATVDRPLLLPKDAPDATPTASAQPGAPRGEAPRAGAPRRMPRRGRRVRSPRVPATTAPLPAPDPRASPSRLTFRALPCARCLALRPACSAPGPALRWRLALRLAPALRPLLALRPAPALPVAPGVRLLPLRLAPHLRLQRLATTPRRRVRWACSGGRRC